jgi:transposase-like protein
MIYQTRRNRTKPEDIVYAVHLYFLGLSLRNTSKALSSRFVKRRSHTAIRDWIQKYKQIRKTILLEDKSSRGRIYSR